MKKVLTISTLFFLLMGIGIAFAQDDIVKHPNCKYCGMDRAKFAHSRVHIEYDDGSALGTCSLHCAAIDLAVNIDKMPMTIMVGDYKSKKLVDAEKSFWVIGGDKMGVMTRRAKWCFGDGNEAGLFIQQHGGNLASFDMTLKAAYEDMYKDIKMIREKRKKMREKKMKKDD
jgi:nitrous oxide reductase accessory protein NosL